MRHEQWVDGQLVSWEEVVDAGDDPPSVEDMYATIAGMQATIDALLDALGGTNG